MLGKTEKPCAISASSPFKPHLPNFQDHQDLCGRSKLWYPKNCWFPLRQTQTLAAKKIPPSIFLHQPSWSPLHVALIACVESSCGKHKTAPCWESHQPMRWWLRQNTSKSHLSSIWHSVWDCIHSGDSLLNHTHTLYICINNYLLQSSKLHPVLQHPGSSNQISPADRFLPPERCRSSDTPRREAWLQGTTRCWPSGPPNLAGDASQASPVVQRNSWRMKNMNRLPNSNIYIYYIIYIYIISWWSTVVHGGPDDKWRVKRKANLDSIRYTCSVSLIFDHFRVGLQVGFSVRTRKSWTSWWGLTFFAQPSSCHHSTCQPMLPNILRYMGFLDHSNLGPAKNWKLGHVLCLL